MWEIIDTKIIHPDSVQSGVAIGIEGGLFAHVGKPQNSTVKVDVNGLLAFPGFINCHDHLLGTYSPRVGDRRPYLNWLEWDNDLKSSPVYKERQLIESSRLYQMGTFRHLLCGVTRVQDHIPHFVRDLFAKDIVIPIIKNFSMAHSVGSFALSWGEGIREEMEKAQKEDLPFITHCSEGFDVETLNSVDFLLKENAINEHTVLVHGIGFTDENIKSLAQAGSHVVWCPASNLYMFETTARVKELRQAGVNVVLGTDSPMSGSINLFEELYIAQNYYREHYGEDLSPRDLLAMVSVNAAKAMRLQNAGAIKKGYLADLVLVDDFSGDPYNTFANMNYENIRLVVIDGFPKFGDPSFIPLFEELDIGYQKIKVDGVSKIINGDILGLLKKVRSSIGYDKILQYLPVTPG